MPVKIFDNLTTEATCIVEHDIKNTSITTFRTPNMCTFVYEEVTLTTVSINLLLIWHA